MFKLCLFDIDQTLVNSSSLEKLRQAIAETKGQGFSEDYLCEYVKSAFVNGAVKYIFSPILLRNLRLAFPELKFGIFTRTYRSYAQGLLRALYPDFQWDVLVCHGESEPKPSPDGILRAMAFLGIKNPQDVLLVGDDEHDMYSAVAARARYTLVSTSWSNSSRPCKGWTSEHWRSYKTIPDAVISNPEKLKDVLFDIRQFLPALESALETDNNRSKDFREISGFCMYEKQNGHDKRYAIYTAGRYISERIASHSSSKSIIDAKRENVFPTAWFDSLFDFIEGCGTTYPIAVTVIPSRQDDKNKRMENFLGQFSDYIEQKETPFDLHLSEDLFFYDEGAQSHHKNRLNRDQRFDNVENHLKVTYKELLPLRQSGCIFVIVDDVCTTGASLVCATRRLREMGIPEYKVVRFAFTSNVSTKPYDRDSETLSNKYLINPIKNNIYLRSN